MQEKLIRVSARALFAAAWVSVVPPAFAISLGDLEVRSALGDVLDARVPLGLAPGEVVDATCFALARDPEAGIPVLTEGLLTVERIGERSVLRIRSSRGVFDPAVRVRVRAACPGRAGEMLRQYSVLLDPRRTEAAAADTPIVVVSPATTAATATAPAANAPAPAATLAARQGDTLRGLATKVFPGNRAARDLYLKAMRDANTALASLADNDPIPAGANVALPDLRTFANASAARTIVASAQGGQRATPALRERAARHKPRARSAATTQATTERPATADLPRPSPGGFVLKLSGNDLDVSRTRTVDDRTRAQLRERLMVLESDDQVAAVLALRNRLTQLEARVNELQLKLAQMPSSFPSRPAETPAAPAAPVSPPPAAAAAPAPAAPAPAAAEPAKPETTPSPAETKETSAVATADTPKAEAAPPRRAPTRRRKGPPPSRPRKKPRRRKRSPMR